MTIATVDVNDQLASVEQIVRGAPRATLRRAFMRAAREFCRQSQYVRETVSGATAAGDSLNELGNDEHMEVVGVFAVSITDAAGNIRGLGADDSSAWDPNAGHGCPTRYQYVPAARVALFPTPDRAYGLRVTAIVVPMEDGTHLPAEVMSKYRVGIESGALAYLHAIPGMPWSSIPEATRHDREFRAEIANAKADVARSFNTGSVRVRPRRFGAGFGR